MPSHFGTKHFGTKHFSLKHFRSVVIDPTEPVITIPQIEGGGSARPIPFKGQKRKARELLKANNEAIIFTLLF